LAETLDSWYFHEHWAEINYLVDTSEMKSEVALFSLFPKVVELNVFY